MSLLSQLSPSSIATTLILILFTHLIIQAITRRFFHPFRSIPGPLSNSISELPATVALVSGNQHTYYRSLHEKYGPVVRVSPDELSFVSVTAREEIYGFRKGRLLMEKSPIFLGAVGGVNGQTGVSLALDAEHSRQRRALGHLFTNTALLQEQDILQVHVEKLIGVLKTMAAEKKAVDCSSWYTYLAFDIMGDLCFSEPFGCLDQASSTEWSTSVINVFIAATWIQGIRRLSGVGTLLESIMMKLLVPPKAAEWRNIHLCNSRDKTIKRLKDGARDHPDFISQILKNSDSKKALTETEIELNMALFISAGTDTTATTLTGWTYFVCTHPQVYERVVGEVRGAFKGGEDIKWENVRKLRYLEATIYEALRLFPPSAASQQRIVPTGGATIDGILIPGGKTVAVSPWASTRSSLNFYLPDSFHPERWLGEDPRFKNDHLDASLPFGTGPRVCIGRNLAYMEMRLITAHILWNFDLELDIGDFKEKNEVWGLDGKMKTMKVFHSMTKPDLWVQLKAVQR
ncbi:hypothetical protein IFR04_009295 [Cadophora malorum]|uniref:Cytochrome P450 n=1 Tax=Cadophora malorum TaxID=108018 RepID=A0A8H7W566_9HELO|nr:hypothetical protein IFR04_009295 [Cadophora malorum]